MLPYKAPVKVHVFNRRWVIRDPQSREVIELTINSNSIDYWKKMTLMAQFIADLMNGRKSVSYDNDSKGYEIMNHLNAPEQGKAHVIPGLIASAEQAQAEKIIDESRVEVRQVETIKDEPKETHEHHKRKSRKK